MMAMASSPIMRMSSRRRRVNSDCCINGACRKGSWSRAAAPRRAAARPRARIPRSRHRPSHRPRDMGQIAQAGFEGDAESEDDETAYAEIVEYVRVGVQLLFEELQPGSMIPSGTLH